ncbi:RNA polymerase subunit sigma-70, partial [Streptomyces nigra]
MLRRKARRGQGGGAVRDVDVLDDPLDAAQERRVRAVLALGGVPQDLLGGDAALAARPERVGRLEAAR